MSSAIAAKLESLLDSPTEIQAWEQLHPNLQARIEKAVIQTPPQEVLTPTSVESLSEIVNQASQHQWPLLICGNSTKLGWGGLVKKADLVLSTQKLNRIIDHASADLTVTVEAGVKLADLQAFLAPHRQFLPIDPAYDDQATIGGIMATADSGSWRQRYGGVRDLVLGFSFVRWDGKIAKAGGRVVKNVAGYDLMKLFTGSYGTLGVITQVTFRLYPLPEASQTVLLTGESQALATTCQALLQSGLAPTMADVLSTPLTRSLNLGNDLGLLVRFQNIPESVDEQVKQLILLGERVGLTAKVFADEAETTLWQQLKTRMLSPTTASAAACKIGIMPNQVVNFLQQCPSLAQIHLGSGLGRLLLETDSEIAQLSQTRSRCENNRGFLTILEASPEIKNQYEPWGYQGNGLALIRRLKEKFDPYSLFNSGRFVGGL